MCGTPATGYGYRDPGLLHTATMTEYAYSGLDFHNFLNPYIAWNLEKPTIILLAMITTALAPNIVSRHIQIQIPQSLWLRSAVN